jgi:broad specificity phosphatase PhoE
MKLAVILYLITACLCEDKLVSVIILSRHGARNPSLKTFDPFSKEDPWKGDGSLTQLGLKQMHALGRYFRKVYIERASFLSDVYSYTEL